MKKITVMALALLFASCGDDEKENSSNNLNGQYNYSVCGNVSQQVSYNNSMSYTITSNSVTYTISPQSTNVTNTLNQLSTGQYACVYTNQVISQNSQTYGVNYFYAQAISLGNNNNINSNTNYRYNYCGTLYYRNGNSGTTGYVLATQNGNFLVYPESSQAQNILNNPNIQTNACVYTNKPVQTSYQGSVIYAGEIRL